MSERVSHRLDTQTASSTGIGRRGFIVDGTVGTLALIATLTGCSGTGDAPVAPQREARARNPDPQHFENLPPGQTVIGVPFSLTIRGPDGNPLAVRARFVDTMTLEIDGDTHRIGEIGVNGHSVRPGDAIAGTDQTVEGLVTDIAPDAANTGLAFRSSLGHARLAHEDLAALAQALRHPPQGQEAEQEIFVRCRVCPNGTGRALIQGGRIFGAIMGRESREVQLPDGVTLRFMSERVPRQAAPAAQPVPPRREAIEEAWGRLRRWFETLDTSGKG